jgi:hypothetical protein
MVELQMDGWGRMRSENAEAAETAQGTERVSEDADGRRGKPLERGEKQGAKWHRTHPIESASGK